MKKPEKSILLTGLRGVGKTVLLNKARLIAREEHNYLTVKIESHENKPLGLPIAPLLRELLYDLDCVACIGHKGV